MEFNRLITLLRKERGITQKQAAQDLGVSQALLSHYEKGIRECGLDFVVRAANYYGVSCDYLLGRSAERGGSTLSVDEIPAPDAAKDHIYKGSVLPAMNKKLIANSLNILFDKLGACKSKELVTEASAYFMLCVYRMFRLMYSAQPKNSPQMFKLDQARWQGYTDAAMAASLANVQGILAEEPAKNEEDFRTALTMTGEELSRDYPLFATSLMNVVHSAEARTDAFQPEK